MSRVKIGEGGYGKVYIEGNVAIKQVKRKDLSMCFMEILIMRNSNCRFVNKTNKVEIDDLYIKIYQEAAVCDLHRWRSNNNHTHDRGTLHWLHQLIQGLGCIHNADIVHGDIKPTNVLVYPDGTLRLTDFGFSRFEGQRADLPYGTIHYSPPEVLANNTQVSRIGDVWALGLTFYFIRYGSTLWSKRRLTSRDDVLKIHRYFARVTKQVWPFREVDCKNIRATISDEFIKRTIIRCARNQIDALIHSMLTIDDERRPTCGMLLQRDLFLGLDVELQSLEVPVVDIPLAEEEIVSILTEDAEVLSA